MRYRGDEAGHPDREARSRRQAVRWRGELQTFDRREIREDHRPQLRDGQALLDGEGRRLGEADACHLRVR